MRAAYQHAALSAWRRLSVLRADLRLYNVARCWTPVWRYCGAYPRRRHRGNDAQHIAARVCARTPYQRRIIWCVTRFIPRHSAGASGVSQRGHRRKTAYNGARIRIAATFGAAHRRGSLWHQWLGAAGASRCRAGAPTANDIQLPRRDNASSRAAGAFGSAAGLLYSANGHSRRAAPQRHLNAQLRRRLVLVAFAPRAGSAA